LGNAAMLGMSIPETPKTPTSTWKSLGKNGSVITQEKTIRNMAAPTSFSGRPLKIG
jgi:hypothetical protein